MNPGGVVNPFLQCKQSNKPEAVIWRIMNSASSLLLVTVLFCYFEIGITQFFYDDVKMYGCRCLQKDQTSQFLNSLTASIPLNANRPIWETMKSSVQKTPTITSNLQSKIEYLKHWLATLTLDAPTVPPTPPTTTTPRPRPFPRATVDPLSLPYDEGMGNSVLRVAYKIMSKYFKKFRGEWTILDRFECVCDGNLVDLLKSKTFINIQIAHD